MSGVKTSPAKMSSTEQRDTLIVVPARIGSERLPGKPLVRVGDELLVRLVVRNALTSKRARAVVVATDDERVAQALRDMEGVRVLVSQGEFVSGTERVLWAAEELAEDFRYVVNWQVDEPGVKGKHIDQLIGAMDEAQVSTGTLVTAVRSVEELFDKNVVKVVIDRQGYALYFSRQAIPFCWEEVPQWMHRYHYRRHVGVYAFYCEVISAIRQMTPVVLEQVERLEQLRWLYHGMRILCVEVNVVFPAVDTPADVRRVEELLMSETG